MWILAEVQAKEFTTKLRAGIGSDLDAMIARVGALPIGVQTHAQPSWSVCNLCVLTSEAQEHAALYLVCCLRWYLGVDRGSFVCQGILGV